MIIREYKRGYLKSKSYPLLNQLGLSSTHWLELTQSFGKKHHLAVGSIGELLAFSAHTNKHWISGQRQQTTIFQ
jgi:hypothetical protein